MKDRCRAAWLMAILALALALLPFCCPPLPQSGLDKPVRLHNAAWLGVEWVDEPHAASEIVALADGLRAKYIDTLYVYTSYMRLDGSFGDSYEYAGEFVTRLKAAYPQVCIQAWIGLPLEQKGPSFWEGYVDLSQPRSRQTIVSFCDELVHTVGFDGIHLDPEPVTSGDTFVLALLEEIRSEIGERPVLSIASRRIFSFENGLLARPLSVLAWSPSYYQAVAARVNEVALMTYDTMLPLPALYRLWTRRQVVEITQALAGGKVRVFIGVPTSEEKTLTHFPKAENMASGLTGVLDGLASNSARPEVVTGVAVYPFWETDAAEWGTYEHLWLDKYRGL